MLPVVLERDALYETPTAIMRFGPQTQQELFTTSAKQVATSVQIMKLSGECFTITEQTQQNWHVVAMLTGRGS